MTTLKDVLGQVSAEPDHWLVPFMDFVDAFRATKDPAAVAEPFDGPADRWAALLASTADYLCREVGVEPPRWLDDVPACREPWFVSGLEDLKAIAIVESPLPFRLRQIFVLENFLSRV